MRRWNGWGDDSVDYPLPVSAARFLARFVGEAVPGQDARLADLVSIVPASRLPSHPAVNFDPVQRALHARGQSFPDWVLLRSGTVPVFPDGVAFPQNETEVVDLLDYAHRVGTRVIPYGGGTSVVGHLSAPSGDAPTLVIDLAERMNRLIQLDETAQLATFQAGVRGPDLEAQLRARGLTLGHYPQSFEYSTLGGWVATRSSGQQSLRYGRIEKLFAGGRLVSPAGALDLPSFPASAAGPDLRELVLGSEGRMGIITEATVRASRLPEVEEFHAVFFPDFERASNAARMVLQHNIPLLMLRLSTPMETTTTLALAGHENLISALEALLAVRGLKDGKCMLLLGFGGQSGLAHAARREALNLCSRFGGVHVGRTFGDQWHKNRFRTPYLRNALWEAGYGVDTLETAVGWSAAPGLLAAIETALREAMAEHDEKVHVFTHYSHLYPHGTSIYTTYLFRLAQDLQVNLERWRAMKSAASRAIVAHGGTISHQHGVGEDHAPYLAAEKGPLGMAVLGDVLRRFDPGGIMNPGKLLEADHGIPERA
jgi:alkyldihydroxyacetonephosphate synthase